MLHYQRPRLISGARSGAAVWYPCAGRRRPIGPRGKRVQGAPATPVPPAADQSPYTLRRVSVESNRDTELTIFGPSSNGHRLRHLRAR